MEEQRQVAGGQAQAGDKLLDLLSLLTPRAFPLPAPLQQWEG